MSGVEAEAYWLVRVGGEFVVTPGAAPGELFPQGCGNALAGLDQALHIGEWQGAPIRELLARDGWRVRVHERGVGETRSCGTGAVAAAAATRWWDGPDESNTTWIVDVPGGRLTVTFTAAGTAELAGPAVLVADGTWTAG